MDKVDALRELRGKLRYRYECFNPEKVQIGDFTYGTPIVRSWGEDAKLRIGKFCSIGGNVKIYLGGNHHTEWCTTYPFNALVPEIWGDIDGGVAATKGDVIIGNDVWIADNVVILSGVTIGDGAVITNGSVIVKDVPEYAFMAGNPAEQRKIRWNAARIGKLKWWDWPLERIAEAAPMLMANDSEKLHRYKEAWGRE